MSDSHDKLPKLFWVQLALAAVIGIMYLITPSKHGGEHGAGEGKVAAVTKNLKPVGAVSTKDAKTSGSAKTRSGEDVYNASCLACHAAGVANAPKPDDKAAWEPRVATGLDTLIKTAIEGKGAMPARGGNPTITDDEIKAAILYMTGKAGFDLSSAKKAEPSSTAMTETTKVAEKTVVKVIEKTAEKVMPVVAAVIPAAPSAPVAPAAPKTMEEAPAKPVAPAVSTEPKAEVVAVSAPTTGNKIGEKIYKSSCFACHEAGIAGSPKLGDKAVWTARIATGNDALYTSAISGKGVMPPKGGNMGLSDDDVKAAVDYMIAQSQ